MSGSALDQLAREFRSFAGRREVVKQLKKDIRTPVPGIRKSIRKHAIAILPKAGGLGKWAAKSRVNVKITASSRTVSATLIGGRNSAGGVSDLKRLDRGRLRHPSWGRRGRGQWHVQRVTEGWFTDPATNEDVWSKAVLSAVDNALKTIRG